MGNSLINDSPIHPNIQLLPLTQSHFHSLGDTPTVVLVHHDDVIKWKYFPRYWLFVRGIHRSPVNSPHKGQWRGALMFTLICARIKGWVNNREAGDFRRYLGHYDVTVMLIFTFSDRHLLTQSLSQTNSHALSLTTTYHVDSLPLPHARKLSLGVSVLECYLDNIVSPNRVIYDYVDVSVFCQKAMYIVPMLWKDDWIRFHQSVTPLPWLLTLYSPALE